MDGSVMNRAVVEAEYKVSMHCNGCERKVAKAISKLKGVETFTTDMMNGVVVIRGRIDPEKVLRKLKKKTGKKVEVVVNDDENVEEEAEMNYSATEYFGDGETHMMFNDENANSCTIM